MKDNRLVLKNVIINNMDFSVLEMREVRIVKRG